MRLSLLLITFALSGIAQAQSPPAEDKIVCKRLDEGYTGSNIRKWKKVCKKSSEWAAQDDETQRKLRAANDKGLLNSDGLKDQLAQPE